MNCDFRRWLADFAGIKLPGMGFFQPQRENTPSREELEAQLVRQTAEIDRLKVSLEKSIADRTQLKTQLQLFESVMPNIDDAVLIAQAEPLHEPGPRITYINDAFTRITGYSRDEVLGKTPRILQGTKTDRLELDKIRSALTRQEPVTAQLLNYRKDGSQLWVETSIFPIFDDRGTCSHFMSIHRDISDRISAEAQLHQKNSELQAIFQALPDLYFRMDARGTILNYYAGSKENLYVPPDEFLGKSMAEVLPADIGERWQASLERVGQSGELGILEYCLSMGESEEWYEARILPFLDRESIAIIRNISDRKRAERELMRIGKAVESVSDAIVIADRSGRSIYHNPAFLHRFNYTPETLNAVGGLSRLFADSDLGGMVFAKIAQGKSWLGEAILYNSDDRKMLVSLRADAIEDREGHIVGLVGICTDVTERRQAETALWETQHLLEQIARTTPTSIYIFDVSQQRNVYLNQAGCQFFGVSPAQLVDRGWDFFADALHPEDLSALGDLKQRFAGVENGEVLETEFRMKSGRGEWRWLHAWEVVFARTPSGVPEKILGTAIDITERKRAEQALLEERNFVAAVLETAGALVSVLDRQGNIIRFNRACEQLTGYTLDEVRHRCIWDLFAIPEELAAVRLRFETLLDRQAPIEWENYWQAKDGTRHLISWSNSVLLDAQGEVKYIIATGLDITERKRAEEVRLALEKERELSALRLRFFSMASHEFRTPLSTILLSAQSLEVSMENWTPCQRLRNIHRIQSATKHMTQLIEDILTINRAETGKLDFDPRPIDLRDLVGKIVAEMQQHLQVRPDREGGIQFESVGEVRPIAVDVKLMRSILTNLLSNAIKYSPDGGEVACILTTQKDGVTLEIIDRGIGIPEGDRDRLFEAFHRGGNVDFIPGSGLGLTVVQKCVELHGGQIRIASEEGVGTTIWVSLPG